jgi:hypothetical protein
VLRTVRGISPDQALAFLQQAGIDAVARPEVLTPADFARLFGLV